jgi:hypothetical protein
VTQKIYAKERWKRSVREGERGYVDLVRYLLFPAVVVVKNVNCWLNVAGDPASNPIGGQLIGPASGVSEYHRADTYFDHRILRMEVRIGSACID